MDKQKLRKEISTLRDQLSIEWRDQASEQIQHQVQQIVADEKAQVIACFVSFRSEVNTVPLIKSLLKAGNRVVLPITNLETQELTFSELKDFEQELELGTYDILEPKKEWIRPIAPEKIDLILMPGLVFDALGYRIGYGGGYYDRFLSKLDEQPLLMALAFDVQVIEEPVPYEEFDIPVDLIVTEKRVIHCQENRKR